VWTLVHIGPCAGAVASRAVRVTCSLTDSMRFRPARLHRLRESAGRLRRVMPKDRAALWHVHRRTGPFRRRLGRPGRCTSRAGCRPDHAWPAGWTVQCSTSRGVVVPMDRAGVSVATGRPFRRGGPFHRRPARGPRHRCGPSGRRTVQHNRRLRVHNGVVVAADDDEGTSSPEGPSGPLPPGGHRQQAPPRSPGRGPAPSCATLEPSRNSSTSRPTRATRSPPPTGRRPPGRGLDQLLAGLLQVQSVPATTGRRNPRAAPGKATGDGCQSASARMAAYR
jgi:hypothetical protein